MNYVGLKSGGVTNVAKYALKAVAEVLKVALVAL